MISKEMYELLKKIPRPPKSVLRKEVNNTNSETINTLISEAAYSTYDYINEHYSMSPDMPLDDTLSLTEKGQAAIEEYEQAERNNKIIEKTLSVSKAAMWAAVASAVVSLSPIFKEIALFVIEYVKNG